MSFEIDREGEYPPRSFFGRFVNILLQPTYEWRVIESEEGSKSEIISNFVAPLLFISGAIGSIIHYLYANDHLPNPSDYVVGILILFINGIVILLAYIYTICFFVNKLSKNFGGISDHLIAFRISSYGITSIVVALLLLDAIKFLTLEIVVPETVKFIFLFMVIYSVYTISKGARFLLDVPKERVFSFSIALIFCMAFSAFIFAYISSSFKGALIEADLAPDRDMIAYKENARRQQVIDDTEELMRSIERMNDSMRQRN